jgi:hypothetical protein
MTNLDSPQSRRVLLGYSQAKWDDLAPSKQREIAGQPGLSVLIVDGDPRSRTQAAAQVLDDYTVSHGDLLVQNPYDTSRYFPEDEAAVEIALEKTLCIAQVCHFLGAKKFGVSSIHNATDNTTWNAEAGGDAKGIRGKFGGDGGKSRQLARRITLEDVSSGGTADVEAARAFLVNRHLASDAMLRSLVDMVEFQGNEFQKRTLTVDVSREAKSALKLAVDVKAAGYVSGKGGGGGAKHAVDQLTVTYEITF